MHAVRRRARYGLPLGAGALCIVATLFVGLVATWLLLTIGFGLLLDGATALWERAGGTGNMTTYRQ